MPGRGSALRKRTFHVGGKFAPAAAVAAASRSRGVDMSTAAPCYDGRKRRVSRASGPASGDGRWLQARQGLELGSRSAGVVHSGALGTRRNERFLSACAKLDHASHAEYRRVWDALVSCTEGILGSGRGAVIEQLGTVTFVSWFVRTFNVVQRAPPPQSSLVAPVVRLSQARIGHAAGVDNDRARVVLASIFGAIGRKVGSGAKLRLPFGNVGWLVAKDRTLSFAFASGFRRPKSDPRTEQDEYDGHVRRILADIEARRTSIPTIPGDTARGLIRPETCPATPWGHAGTKKQPRTPLPMGKERSSRTRRGGAGGGGGGDGDDDGDGALPPPVSSNRSALLSSRRGCLVTGRGRPGTAAAVVGGGRSGEQARPGQESCRLSSKLRRASSARGGLCRFDERPESPTPRPIIAGAAAIVAGGRVGQDKDEALAAGGGGRAGGQGVGAGGGGVDASPRTANKVLPHFLAIGNPGSQALVPKEGAEIVRKQVARWAEYEERHAKERARLRDYLVAAQAEAQRAARAQSKNAEFLSRNTDPNRAYPCRTEYNVEKEAAWRRRWCSDLEAQIDLKKALEVEAKCAEVTRDRERAEQLEAAIKSDRRREAHVKRLDRARINKAWETQVALFARGEAGDKRAQHFILDKIVR
eukprot:jgi/Undpi1/1936/HiC_scaffold_12.g05323.m1